MSMPAIGLLKLIAYYLELLKYSRIYSVKVFGLLKTVKAYRGLRGSPVLCVVLYVFWGESLKNPPLDIQVVYRLHYICERNIQVEYFQEVD